VEYLLPHDRECHEALRSGFTDGGKRRRPRGMFTHFGMRRDVRVGAKGKAQEVPRIPGSSSLRTAASNYDNIDEAAIGRPALAHFLQGPARSVTQAIGRRRDPK
jgi:hypothetical protein